MVRKRSKDGGYYHEPPYTWDEQMDLYRRTGNAGELVIARLGPRPEPQPSGSPPPDRKRKRRPKPA